MQWKDSGNKMSKSSKERKIKHNFSKIVKQWNRLPLAKKANKTKHLIKTGARGRLTLYKS